MTNIWNKIVLKESVTHPPSNLCLSSLEISAHFHHFSLRLSFFFSSLQSTWILPSTGGGVGGDSVCFQPFFLNPQKKQKLSFLPKIQSLLILFLSFFFFFFKQRQAWMQWQKFPSNLSFFLLFVLSFSFFFFFFFHDYLFFLLFLCSIFPPFFFSFFYIFHFFFSFCGRSFPPPSTLCTRNDPTLTSRF